MRPFSGLPWPALSPTSTGPAAKRPKSSKANGVSDEEGRRLFTIQDKAQVFDLTLKPDHQHRPLWVIASGNPLHITVYLEVFSPLYAEAAAFLVAIAEPVTRPFFVHEYRITSASLFTAVSIGMSPESVVMTLNKLSKATLSESLTEFVHHQARAFGKAVLVLRGGRYFIQSRTREVMEQMWQDEEMREGLVGDLNQQDEELQVENAVEDDADNPGELQFLASSVTTSVAVHSVEVHRAKVQRIKQLAIQKGFPLLNEYDFRHDDTVEDIELELRERAKIRGYQRKGLTKMFGNGRARSGIIVLPCGAGKTFVGITACCTVKKPALVLCSSGLACEQWKNQFKFWSNASETNIMRFTAGAKDAFTDKTTIVITTYNMLAHSGHRSKAAQAILNKISSRVWGILVLDEVHVVPSEMFRKVVSLTAFHTALGLTATLVREDEKISDLSFLIGPKLYEANWWELVTAGDLARVECCEVHCRMTKEFFRYYVNSKLPWQQRLLAIMNPAKIQACQYIMDFHEKLGDKILVFCDDVFALLTYARVLNRPFVYGATPLKERMRILSEFRHSAGAKTVFISKIGDQAIDLPEATIIIQVASHFGSRRQEAQRLGRILRAKPQSDNTQIRTGFRCVSEALASLQEPSKQQPTGDTGTLQQRRLKQSQSPAAAQVAVPNAFFYSLVSGDTSEMYFSTKRQVFLVDQGYSFKVLTGIPPAGALDSMVYATKESQVELLTKVLAVTTDTLEADAGDGADDLSDQEGAGSKRPQAQRQGSVRKKGNLANLSGAGNMLYTEYMAAESGKATASPVSSSSASQKRHANTKRKLDDVVVLDEVEAVDMGGASSSSLLPASRITKVQPKSFTSSGSASSLFAATHAVYVEEAANHDSCAFIDLDSD